jgi:hypothetical protein
MRDWKFRPARDDTGAEVRVRIQQSIGSSAVAEGSVINTDGHRRPQMDR